MDVELVRWPGEEIRLDEIRGSRPGPSGARPGRRRTPADRRRPRGLGAPAGVRRGHPAPGAGLEDRAAALEEANVPELDENGLLRWAALGVAPAGGAPAQGVLLDRYHAVVSREALARAGWPDGIPGRNVLDVHIVRLRRRLCRSAS